MNESSLRVHIDGPAVAQGRIPLRYLTQLGRQIQTAVERTGLVLAGLASGQRGRTPEEIRAACNLHVVALQAGSFAIALDLPRAQLSLPGLNFGEQILEHSIEGLEAIRRSGRELPAGYDLGVLVAWRDLGGLLLRDIDKLDFELHTTHVRRTVTYDAAIRDRVAELIEGPLEDRVVLEGRLLMADFHEPRLRCRLHPPGGRSILCTFSDDLADEVSAALRHYVRVAGVAEKDPRTGEIQALAIRSVEMLDLYGYVEIAQAVEPAVRVREPADFWRGLNGEALAAEQEVEPVESLEQIWGDFWPEEESVDEFIATVRAWRQQEPSD